MNTLSSWSWADAQLFLCVAENKSFSAAAKVLGVGQATISRRIKELEQKFELQLFVRGKHGAEPTADALRLIPPTQHMAKWAAEFDRAVKGSDQTVAGNVVIAAPPGVAVGQLAPFAAILKELEPAITLEVLSAIDHIDLSRGMADVAIRTKAPQEPQLVTLYRLEVQLVVVASKEYSSGIQQPCKWGDLDWVTWGGQYRNLSPRPMLENLIDDFSPVFASDDYVAQQAAVEKGLGAMITSLPLGMTQSNLVEIDVGAELPQAEFYIVCAKSMEHLPKIRVVVERLIQAIEGAPEFQLK